MLFTLSKHSLPSSGIVHPSSLILTIPLIVLKSISFASHSSIGFPDIWKLLLKPDSTSLYL